MSNNFATTEPQETDANKVSLLNTSIRDAIKCLTETVTTQFPSDANYTPTAATVRASRKLIVTSVGSLTATRNLVLPLEKHVFHVFNNTTGGKSIQVIGSTGTGVTIPNNEHAEVIFDGTNFVLLGYMAPSPPGYCVLGFSADSLTVSVGTTYFAWVNFITTVAGTTERWIAIPKGGKLSNLRVICGVAPTGGTVTFTVRKKAAAGGAGAGTDTLLLCTMAIAGTIATDTTNVITVADGDEISVKIVENVSFSGGIVRVYISMLLTL